MPTKLPESLLRPPDGYWRDLQIGERANIMLTEMTVDADNNCYLDPGAALYDELGMMGIVSPGERGITSRCGTSWANPQNGAVADVSRGADIILSSRSPKRGGKQ